MPSHNHSLRWGYNTSQFFQSSESNFGYQDSAGHKYMSNANNGSNSNLMNSTGGGGSHNHSMSGTATINCKYCDIIIASRN
jgi:hypothetical protein